MSMTDERGRFGGEAVVEGRRGDAEHDGHGGPFRAVRSQGMCRPVARSSAARVRAGCPDNAGHPAVRCPGVAVTVVLAHRRRYQMRKTIVRTGWRALAVCGMAFPVRPGGVCPGGAAVQLRLRPAADHRLRHRRRHLRRQAQGAERRQDEHQPVPGAQLGQEPQMLQKMRAGDIDFVITSTANASTLAPQAGVLSLHFIFRDQQHLARSLRRPGGLGASSAPWSRNQVQGSPGAGPRSTMGLRNMYSKQEVKSVDDIKGREDAGPGDQDRGHALSGLRRADGAHAVRRASTRRCRPAW